MPHWPSLTKEELVAELRTDPRAGLTRDEAMSRLEIYGPNELAKDRPRSVLTVLAAQFKDILVLILFVSMAVAVILGETLDAAVILSIVVVNALLGAAQERKAERALTALRHLAVPEATVIRDGSLARVPGPDLVPGDLVVLQTGDVVPADLRLLEAVNLKTDESPLTGESQAVEKNAAFAAAPEMAAADQANMAFLGTTVTYGRGRGLVVRTGTETEMGRIATLVAAIEDRETPLQRKISEFGRWLGLACLGICAAVFILGILRGEQPFEMFMTAVSLAVAAIPEGLPALVAIVLALGVRRMIARHAVIRRLPAVETLGCATFVCSDKTGTLTENRMTVTELYLPKGEKIAVGGAGEALAGGFVSAGGETMTLKTPDLHLLLEACLLCNDAELNRGMDGQAVTVAGDPTEAALIVLAVKAGLDLESIRRNLPRISEIPFDSERKLMTTVHERPGESVAFTKGAPDVMLGRCASQRVDGWLVAILGYGMLLAVPLLALAGNWRWAAVFIMLERAGKAIRSPGKDALLSHATLRVGTGVGFGLHEALDQIGGFIGPLIFTAAIALTGGYRSGFVFMTVPALLTLAAVLAVRARYHIRRSRDA